MRLFLAIVLGSTMAALAILFLGSLGQLSPGNPWIAAAIGLSLVVLVVASLRGLLRARAPQERQEPEDVGELDVFFVCGECGTEFRVEKLGELQVPRHCGEPMRAERRARQDRAG